MTTENQAEEIGKQIAASLNKKLEDGTADVTLLELSNRSPRGSLKDTDLKERRVVSDKGDTL